jgi:retron-type reverse transcriptase
MTVTDFTNDMLEEKNHMLFMKAVKEIIEGKRVSEEKGKKFQK